MIKQSMIALACCAALLAGCSGGSDGDETDGGEPAPPPVPATAEVPDSASESTDGFITYLLQLVASSADTLEPVDVSAVKAPTSDTTEPVAFNE